MAWGMSAYLAYAQMPASPGQFPAMQGEMADDSLRTLAGKVASYARKTPQEIVSVHMDNNCYFLGDTIWYKAYVLREGKMAPSDISACSMPNSSTRTATWWKGRRYACAMAWPAAPSA